MKKHSCDPCRGTRSETITLVHVFKRVVARRAVYHTLNVITISLYVRPSVCVERVLPGGWVGPAFEKNGQ